MLDLISRDDPTQIFNNFVHIGRGGLADVYSAVDRRSGEKIALKIMKLTAQNFGFLVPEIINHKNCQHPNVVDFIDAYFLPEKQELWVALELMTGGDLTSTLTSPYAVIPMPEPEIAYICIQILNALNYMHQGNQVHRDLKSDNVLLNVRGEFKLADFGMAVQLTAQKASLKTVVGSPYWMAPEILMEKNYGKEVDVWSFGCIVIEMIDGNPPHYQFPPERAIKIIVEQGAPQPRFIDRVSPELKDFLACCVQFEPKKRATVEQLLRHPFIQKYAGLPNPFKR